MKKFAVVFVLSLFVASIAYAETTINVVTPEAPATTEVAAPKYFCPMDGFTSDKAGKCEKCGMELVETPAILAEVAAELPVAPAAE